MEEFVAIRKEAKILADHIRELCRSQADVWRTIPELALDADGRSGYSDRYAMAYRHKLWPLEATLTRAGYGACVDLETGEIVRAFNTSQLADDGTVLKLAPQVFQLAATQIANLLHEEASTMRAWHIKPRTRQELAELKANLALPAKRGRTDLVFG